MHEVLVNSLGGLSLPRKSVVRLTDRPDMTLDVYRGCKTTKQQTTDENFVVCFLVVKELRISVCLNKGFENENGRSFLMETAESLPARLSDLGPVTYNCSNHPQLDHTVSQGFVKSSCICVHKIKVC